MLFNSYAFLLGFFPVTFCVFFVIARRNREFAASWLAIASLFFYGYWSIKALPLLVGSICVNYWFGVRLSPTAGGSPRLRHSLLVAALVANLGVLGYFKYANFFISNANWALHAFSAAEFRVLNVALPIGISFFTFTQIAFLVDCYEGKVLERKFVHYLLFVAYFPHLISGPVLHHGQMMPQFRRAETYRLQANNLLSGLFNVTTGLVKKVLFADELSQYATPIFDAARDGHELGIIIAWTGVLAYTLQIYFDFSGYSDMAIGLSRMLGIQLPLNFNAPYKSANIIDFWRRWHMSLSHFLRDYLYVPLGGNRSGAARRYVNLMLTMLLGGLWHGASWTFVVWGGLHGTYLLINHAWRRATSRVGDGMLFMRGVGRFAARTITFLAVVLAWVFFRAPTFDGAERVLRGMIAPWPACCSAQCYQDLLASFSMPPVGWVHLAGLLCVGFLIVWALPTSQAITQRIDRMRGKVVWAGCGGLLFCIALLAVINASHRRSEFIYFNF